jgi:hypothetical protein
MSCGEYDCVEDVQIGRCFNRLVGDVSSGIWL